jgi:hypothetical protein
LCGKTWGFIHAGSGVTVDDRTYDDAAFFTQNDSFNNILKFGTRFTAHPVYAIMSQDLKGPAIYVKNRI